MVGYKFWNNAVLRVGPNKAEKFMHLMPVIASLLAIAFVGGIWLTSRADNPQAKAGMEI